MEKPKKFLNNEPAEYINEVINGLLHERPKSLKRLEKHNVVLLNPILPNRVHLLSGGGSGHEPSHAGFIGENMLSGAILGGVFASPSVSQILAAVRAVTKPQDPSSGCLLIVKNYTGDRLNFGMACELANAEGRNTQMVVVDDDCALPNKKGVTGCRGIAGTVFVHKVAGAAAAQGLSLKEVTDIANLAISKIGSLGVSLESVTLPGAKEKNERLKGDLMEIGLGIHGEAGVTTTKCMPVDEMVSIMIDTIYKFSPPKFSLGENVVVLVNNLGGTSNFEMSIVAQAVAKQLEKEPYNLFVKAMHVGTFMTSFEMHGVSLSVFSLDSNGLFEKLLQVQTDAPAWDSNVQYLTDKEERTQALIPIPIQEDVQEASEITAFSVSIPDFAERISKAIVAACDAIISNEPQLTKFDTIVGDGDCGITLSRGATEVKSKISSGTIDTLASPSLIFTKIAEAVSDSMGGTSGILFELFFRKMASHIKDFSTEGTAITPQAFCQAFVKGVEAISFYGGATVGSRTMLDALVPASVEASMPSSDNVLKEMADAAKKGALSTALMKEALAGRSNYLSEDVILGTPDPGAMAIGIILEAISDSF